MTTQNITPDSKIEGVCDAYGVITELWERCSCILTKDELEWFANAGEYAEHVAFQLEHVVEGVGCMVTEGDSGYFRPESNLSMFLFSIAQQISQIRGLVEVSQSASDRLIHPERYEFPRGESKSTTQFR